jgi:hypothetical protein
VAGITGKLVTEQEIDEHLYALALYQNDQNWCEELRQEFGLQTVAFATERMAPGIAHLRGAGIAARWDDPRLVILVRRVLTYRHANNVVISFPQGRMHAEFGQLLLRRLGARTYESDHSLTEDLRTRLLRSGSGWAGMFPAPGTIRSA